MKIYQNGDRCPCCGAEIEGASEERLEVFSQLCHVLGLEELEAFSPETQEMDTGILNPPDAGINPPVKPIEKR